MRRHAIHPFNTLPLLAVALVGCNLDAKHCIGDCELQTASDADSQPATTGGAESSTGGAEPSTGAPEPATTSESPPDMGEPGICGIVPSGGGMCQDGLLEPGDICFSGASMGDPIMAGANGSAMVPADGDVSATLMLTFDGDNGLYMVSFGSGPSGHHDMFLPDPLVLAGSADFDGDGEFELVAHTNGQIYLFHLNSLHDLVNWSPSVKLDELVTLDVTDWNGDGHLDIVATGSRDGDPVQVFGLHGDGAGGFTWAPGPQLPWTASVHALGALDPDGLGDDFVFTPGPRVIQHVDGVQHDFTLDLPPELHARAVAIADLDHDGRGDIVTLADNTDIGTSELVVTLQSPEFTSTRYPAACGAAALEVSDFDVDGHPDLVVVGAAGSVTIRRGDGQGGFADVATTTMPSSADRVHVTDLNGDSAPDLVVIGPDQISYSLSAP